MTRQIDFLEKMGGVSVIDVNDLSLEEKVGQVFMFGFSGKDPNDARELIEDLKVGGIIYFARNTGSLEDVSNLSSILQQWAQRNPSGLPLFISADQEGGIVSRLTEGIPVMPGPMSLAAADGPSLVFQVSKAIAQELRAGGINMNLAPCLDVNDNPENPVIGVRSFGSDPKKVAELGSEAVNGFMAGGVVPVGKHFPGHGNTSLDSHLELPVLLHPRQRLDQVELVPFKKAIGQGLPAIMSAHIIFSCIDPKRPGTLSPHVLQGLLRKTLGFDGLIMTDCLEMNAISKHFGTVEGAVNAFKAGCDVLLISHTRDLQKKAYEALLSAVKANEISEERLNESCSRILKLKQAFNLPNQLPKESLDFDLLRALSEQSHEDSITLVRDEKGLVPLTLDEKPILLATVKPKRLLQVEDAPQAETPGGNHAGVYKTIKTDLGKSLVRLGGLAAETEAKISERIQEVFMEDEGALEKCLAIGKDAARVIIVSQSAKKNPLQSEFIKTVAERLERVILVASRDPYDIHVAPSVGIYLCTYSTRPEAMDALGKVLLGIIEAKGRLPVDKVL